jgi:hypothetical protein
MVIETQRHNGMNSIEKCENYLVAYFFFCFAVKKYYAVSAAPPPPPHLDF